MGESEELPPKPVPTETSGIDSETETAKQEPTISQPSKSSWKHLFAFTTWSHAGPLVAALVASGAAAALKTVFAVVLGEVLDVVGDYSVGERSSTSTLSSISRWSTILIALGLGNWMANSAFLALWIAFGELQATSIRQEIFNGLLSKDMAWFDSQEQGVSSLLVRIQTQTRELQLATSQILGLLVCDILTALASLAVALYYSWKLTLVLLATLPLSAFILSLAAKKLDPAIQAQRNHLAKASKHAAASITAIDLVKVFNGYDHELWQYFQAIQQAAKNYLIQAKCTSIQMGYVGFWCFAIFVAGFWYGLVLVEQGLPVGSVLTTFYATLASFQGIEALMPHFLVLSKGMSAGAFLEAVTTSSNGLRKIRKMGRTVRPETCAGDIELTNVSFAYPSNPKKKVLNESSLFFPTGELTFIVGESGSGKSTIGNLIANFYEPLTGDVQVDGQSMRVLDEQWVRENVTLIQQSSVLFNETLFQNVAFGHRHPDSATREEVLAACDAAILQPTLAALPDGLDTRVGFEGHDLSGGQKQRLALARARLRDPPVLVLDEVTSGLDQVSRSLVMDAIRRWRHNKTTIIITHDVSQIEDGDFIYVMNKSFLVQEGFKRDLLKNKEGHLALLATPAPDEHDHNCPELNVIPPDTPDTPVVRSRSGRVTDFIVGKIENNALQPPSPGLLRSSSLRPGGSFALRLKLDDVCVSTDVPARVSSFRADGCQNWDEEKKRFSKYVTQQFSLPEGKPQPTPPDKSVNYVFGSAYRRSNISSLRIKPTMKQSSPSEEETPLTPTDNIPKKKDSVVTTLKTVWPTLGARDRITLVLGIMACMIGAGSTPAFSYCFAQLLDVMISPGDKVQQGGKWAAAILGIAVVDGLGWGGGRYMLERVGQSWVNAIRTEALKRILLQPKPWFGMSKNSPGRITECLDRNAEEMRNIVGKFIPIIVAVATMISISVIWALVVSWKLSLVALAPLPVVMGAIKGFAVVSGKWETKCNKGAEDASAALTETFLNIRVVRALTLEKHFTDKYQDLVAHTLSIGLGRGGYTCSLYGLYQSMGYALTSLVFYYGTVLLADKKELSFAEVMQVVNLLLFSIGTSADILSSIPQLTMAQATASQMLGYASMSTQPPEGQRGQVKLESPLPVKMSHLQFSYSGHSSKQALRGAYLEIQPGKCTAIVGNSGGGKSTVVSILMGLLVPQDPFSLTFDGIPSSQVDMQHLRSQMAYVSQSPYLFPDTIANNITYGLPEDSPYRQSNNIYQAAKAAGLHEWIASLPEGYRTLVGDGGQSLSGGQAQRLSIARALVRQPRLLVLDEPTSSLDAESTGMIRQTIHGLKSQGGDMAVVLVTHSREMMKVADWIVMLGEGGVTLEKGVYTELWESRGHFARLVSGGEWIENDASAGSW